MATGWAKDGAVQEQIDSTIQEGIELARSRLGKTDEGLTHCQACGNEIPPRRREAIKGVRLCVPCQEEEDKQAIATSGVNRRASKDSQLR